MSRSAKLFITKFYKGRGQAKPLALSINAAADLMEAYWQKKREGIRAKRLDKEVQGLSHLIRFIKQRKP